MRSAIDSLVFDWLHIDAPCARSCYAERLRETSTTVLNLCERGACEKFALYHCVSDIGEPFVRDGRAVLLQPASFTSKTYPGIGMIGATLGYGTEDMQLPFAISHAANEFFSLHANALARYPLTHFPRCRHA